jgi:hypothetical protein
VVDVPTPSSKRRHGNYSTQGDETLVLALENVSIELVVGKSPTRSNLLATHFKLLPRECESSLQTINQLSIIVGLEFKSVAVDGLVVWRTSSVNIQVSW